MWQICDRMFRRASLVKSRLKEIEREREDYVQCAPWRSLLAPVTQWKVETAVKSSETEAQARKPILGVNRKTFFHIFIDILKKTHFYHASVQNLKRNNSSLLQSSCRQWLKCATQTFLKKTTEIQKWLILNIEFWNCVHHVIWGPFFLVLVTMRGKFVHTLVFKCLFIVPVRKSSSTYISWLAIVSSLGLLWGNPQLPSCRSWFKIWCTCTGA